MSITYERKDVVALTTLARAAACAGNGHRAQQDHGGNRRRSISVHSLVHSYMPPARRQAPMVRRSSQIVQGDKYEERESRVRSLKADITLFDEDDLPAEYGPIGKVTSLE